MKPTRTLFALAAAAAWGVLAASGGCGGGGGPADAESPYSGRLIGDLSVGQEPPPDVWGDDWEQRTRARLTPSGDPGRSSGRRSEWVVVLETFPGEGNQHAAQTMLAELAKVAPQLTGARVHSTSKGSMVVYGHYGGPDDPAAQQDLEWIKSISYQQRPVFPRAMLGRITSLSAGGVDPLELYAARLMHPDVDPLYSLEVAVWSDFGSGEISEGQIRAQAEAFARKLRAEGLEAYYLHDADRDMSIVTVGLFDRTAVDSRSGLYAPQVEALMQRFSALLVNGEPLRRPIHRERLELGTEVQRPILVHVPDL